MTKTPQVAALPGMTPLGLKPQLYAHLTRARAADRPFKYELTITENPTPNIGALMRYHVLDKRTARKEAARFNATPWNF